MRVEGLKVMEGLFLGVTWRRRVVISDLHF